MTTRRIAHWEATALVSAGALAAWTADPGTAWAAAALLAAVGTLALTIRARRPLAVALASLLVVGAAGSLLAARRIRAVETRWPVEREALIEDARRRLNATLGEAVDLARELATVAANEAGGDPADGFAALQAALRPGAPEHGVVLFDGIGRPVSWAGRHRVPVALRSDDLYASITPFYVVLTAQRQRSGWTAGSTVLLAADSAVPDRDNSVAARFAVRTGVGLQFIAPRGARALWNDLFDYCLPSCRDSLVVPDTLFSVRVVPPAQGERKLELLAAGRRWSAAAALLGLALLLVAGGAWIRYAATSGIAALFLFTPAGEHLGLRTAFSPATYFFAPLGAFSASAGALLLSAGLAAVATAALWRRGVRPSPMWGVGSTALLLATPYVLRQLSQGITPPGEGVSIGLWLSWEVAITAASCLPLLLAAALRRGAERREAPLWTAWFAGAWAAVLAIAGVLLWDPVRLWPWWYFYLWIPAFVLAVRQVGLLRSAAVHGIVVGSAAALLVWGSVMQGRIALAERDLRRVATAADPLTVGLLERFGARLAREPLPTSAAALYRAWQRSALAQEDYPAVLATWDRQGRVLARLDLAELDLSNSLLQALGASAAERGTHVIEAVQRAPGGRYVLAAPFPDGAVMTVGIAPRSRLFPPVRVARFLRGERVTTAPYEMLLSEPFTPLVRLSPGWQREGWVVRAERPLGPAAESRHVHLRVDLGAPGQLAIRGTLVLVVDVVALAILFLAGSALAGTWRLGLSGLRSATQRRSYRARLTLVLSVFLVTPTVGFAVWSVLRVQAGANDDALLLTRQTLRDAAAATRDLGFALSVPGAEELQMLGARYGADLLMYRSGVLLAASTPVLQELGLVDPYMPSSVFRYLRAEDELEVARSAVIGGRTTQVGYRSLGIWRGAPVVLGAPRLLNDAGLLQEREDLVLALTLATLGGLAAAAWLAALAARALAKPVHALRAAAVAVGQGQPLPPRDPSVPTEFVPVVEGLERMALDVRASQAALEAARQRTAGVLRSVATGVVALDRTFRITMANPRAEELLGVTLREGADARALTGEDWQSLWEWVAAFREGDAEPQAHELVVDERRVRAQVAPLGGDGGCVVALDDTTDLARAVRVLAWGELARQIAHEIKNPLTPVRLGVQHLERAYRDRRADYGDTLHRTAQQILAEIERLDAIARAFARFGAPPAEAGPLTRENVAEAARETAQLYALGGDTVVSVEAAHIVHARVRRDEFKEVLVNLVENARTAGARRVQIALQAPDGGGARIAVSDDGKGILPEHLPRIFEPQFSTTTSGTGLGLAICKRLVESWGGSIGVTSEPRKGTIVTIVTEA